MDIEEKLFTIAENYDADQIVEVLGLSSEEVVEAFRELILEKVEDFFSDGL